jgi:hypothetical protein
VSFAAITLCVAFQRVFIVLSVYFVIDSARKLLDTPLILLFQVFEMKQNNDNFETEFRLIPF